MLIGNKANYSYAFYGVNNDFEIYDLLSGKVVDKFLSYKGHTDKEDVIHNILSKGISDTKAKEILAYKGFLYAKDVRIAKEAIKLLYKARGKSIPTIKQSKLKNPLVMFGVLYALLICILACVI
ncbi:MAG TPA: hypothetical protein DEQ48_03555 [Helicobacter sp.]|nr:hypothetical protein [Helicobacter sp.]